MWPWEWGCLCAHVKQCTTEVSKKCCPQDLTQALHVHLVKCQSHLLPMTLMRVKSYKQNQCGGPQSNNLTICNKQAGSCSISGYKTKWTSCYTAYMLCGLIATQDIAKSKLTWQSIFLLFLYFQFELYCDLKALFYFLLLISFFLFCKKGRCNYVMLYVGFTSGLSLMSVLSW